MKYLYKGSHGSLPQAFAVPCDIAAWKGRFFQIGRIGLGNAFVYEQDGLFSIFSSGSNKNYRYAFKRATSINITGLDIDHLYPINRTMPGYMHVIGAIDSLVNRSAKDNSSKYDAAAKAFSALLFSERFDIEWVTKAKVDEVINFYAPDPIKSKYLFDGGSIKLDNLTEKTATEVASAIEASRGTSFNQWDSSKYKDVFHLNMNIDSTYSVGHQKKILSEMGEGLSVFVLMLCDFMKKFSCDVELNSSATTVEFLELMGVMYNDISCRSKNIAKKIKNHDLMVAASLYQNLTKIK